jgi:light-regulated signal transduction histidine kinase (bacteriophytochrome)
MVFRIVTAGGETRWVNHVCRAIRDHDGALLGVGAANRDVTAAKEAEERLAQSARKLRQANRSLAAKNRELDEFAHIASHDLQEPLRKLTAFSEMLLRDVSPEQLGDDAREDIHYITQSAQRMQQLVESLLRLSRAGRSGMHLVDVDVGECVDEDLEALAVAVEESGAVVTREPLPTVRGDRALLTQLFQNLLGNALKFRGDAPPRIRITCEPRPGGHVLGVKDNGIGIQKEYLTRIFAPFQRLYSREVYEGTGIGLAICQKVVQRHGGVIWAESEPGGGSHFRFTLAGNEAEETDGYSRAAPAAGHHTAD